MPMTFPAAPVRRIVIRIGRIASRLRADTRANVLLIVAASFIPMLVAAGFGVDYANAEMIQTQLNAAADAAVLAGVDPSMLCEPSAIASSAVSAMFQSEVTSFSSSVTFPNGYPTPTVTPQTTSTVAQCTGYLRTVTLTYTAAVPTMFSSLIGLTTLPITGSSTANASQPPNINFYIAVDTSPSMLIPSTTTGISLLQGATGGCAFACHVQTPPSSNVANIPTVKVNGTTYYIYVPSATYSTSAGSNQTYMLCTAVASNDTSCSGNYYDTAGKKTTAPSSGYFADGYWITQNYGLVYGGSTSTIDLRINDASQALQDLIPYAYNMSQQFQTTYGFQMYQFANATSGNGSGTSGTSATAITGFSTMQTLTSTNYKTLTVPNLGSTTNVDYWVANDKPNSSVTLTYDWASDFTRMFNSMYNLMPSAGSGASTSTPQEVLLLITDGMVDEYNSASSAEGISGLARGPLTATDIAMCNQIKTKLNVQIAVLYTQYLPSAISSGYSYEYNEINPTDTLVPALQSCASKNALGQPLFYQVSTDQSISAALQALFTMTIQNARLVQ